MTFNIDFIGKKKYYITLSLPFDSSLLVSSSLKASTSAWIYRRYRSRVSVPDENMTVAEVRASFGRGRT